MIAEVIIEYPIKSLDKTFSYIVPDELSSVLKVGMKVIVPFGNQEVNGFVLKLNNNITNDYEMKEIINIVDKNLILDEELLQLGKYMSKKYLCTMINAYQVMLPTGLKIKSQKTNYNIYDTFILLNQTNENIKDYINLNKKGKKQNEILNILLEKEEVNKKEINHPALKILLEKNLIKEKKIQKYRLAIKDLVDKKIKLTSDQESVFKSLVYNKYETYLLYGITGSGKTEVYLNWIEEVVNTGKTAIMLVSEISLTMQIVKRFYARFNEKVAVFHSALSDGEKHDEYLKIIRGEVKVVVGTRSAIFAPLKNLGIIIIDEEHSDTYKQDNNPRYSAKDMAQFRCEYNNAPLVLGSATPVLETAARSKKDVYKLLVLNKRIGKAKLPNTSIVDMTDEIKKGNNIFSEILKNEIINTIKKDEQVILLLNRRGFSTFINCSSCGYVYKCPSCDISLTYHKTTNNLVCHYCGYLTKKATACPECKEDSLNYLGLGTQKLEEYITNEIPEAKVIRMDQDTTTRKGSHDKIIDSFKNKEYNILLGTQMISKGLDFPDVTLVGVINADTTLNIPDYKANENTFSLLSQVAGRSGRSEKEGKVIIQTYNPDNYILKCVKNNDYKSFYAYEMQIREKLKYPPYYFLIGIKVISKEYNTSLDEAKKIVSYLKNNLKNDVLVMGPTTASILKFNNKYRFQIIIKYKNENNLFSILKELDIKYGSNNNVYLEIDVHPNRI